jgi:hypothetical protein
MSVSVVLEILVRYPVRVNNQFYASHVLNVLVVSEYVLTRIHCLGYGMKRFLSDGLHVDIPQKNCRRPPDTEKGAKAHAAVGGSFLSNNQQL